MALVRAIRLINNITGGNYTGATLNSALGNAVTLSDYEQAINVRSQARNFASSISGITVAGASTIAANEIVASPVAFYEVFYSGPALAAFASQTPGFNAINANSTAKNLVKSSFTRDNALIGGLTGSNLTSWVDGSWLLAPSNVQTNDPFNAFSVTVYGSTNGMGPTEAAFWGGDTFYKSASDGGYTVQYLAFTSNMGQTWTNAGNVGALMSTSGRILFTYANGFIFASGNGLGNSVVYYYIPGSGWTGTYTFPGSSAGGGVAYGAGRYVAVSAGTEAAYATSHIGPWTASTIPFGGYRIYFENNLFFLIGSAGQVATSTDGITWTTRSTNTSSGGPLGFFIKNNRYFICGGTGVMTSPDAITWTATNPVGTNNHHAVEFFNGTYYAATSNGYATSTNGTTWTKPSTIPGLGITNNLNFYDIKVVGGVLYMQASNRTIYSLDGTSFLPSPLSIAGCCIATKKTGATPATSIFQDQSKFSYGLK